MTIVTLEKLNQNMEEIKGQLNRITFILEEDFELSEEAKKELKQARKQALSEYIDHEEVIKEFT